MSLVKVDKGEKKKRSNQLREGQDQKIKNITVVVPVNILNYIKTQLSSAQTLCLGKNSVN